MKTTTPQISNSKRTKIYFDFERPYIEIIGVNSNYTTENLQKLKIEVIFEIIGYDNEKTSTKKIILNNHYDIETRNLIFENAILEVNKSTKEVFCYFQCCSKQLKQFEEELFLEFKYQLINRLESENQHHLFKNHLSESDNLKIMFSAPFGHGKSTFLEYFFKDEKENYDVIKLTPINYSVASNEDIFKYIKSDILIQLMEFKLDYESNKTSYFNSFFQFSKNNLDKILIPFLRIVPLIGKPVHSITKDIIKLKDEYFEYHQETDEPNKAYSFIQDLYEKEGSIYEDNFYTQLIRQLLEILKQKTEKQSILIIDDLDRMDPEHIFRILNVLSVHFDSFSTSEIEIHNKFGFDKIILVCDYENIRKIYEHKYGKDVDFGGYINKYYSKKVFYFNYTNEINSLLINIDDISQSKDDLYSAFRHISSALFDAKILSLRDLLKIKSIGLKSTQKRLLNSKINDKNWFNYGIYSPVIAILCDVLGTSVFKAKLGSLNVDFISNNILNINYSCEQLLASYKADIREGVNKFEYKNYTIHYATSLYENELQNIKDKTSITFNENGADVNPGNFFNQHVFLHLFLKNVEEYETIKSSL